MIFNTFKNVVDGGGSIIMEKKLKNKMLQSTLNKQEKEIVYKISCIKCKEDTFGLKAKESNLHKDDRFYVTCNKCSKESTFAFIKNTNK